MILVCPNCSTRFLLSASALGEDGRDVRCAKCQHEWFAGPSIEEAAEPDIVDNIPAAEQEGESDTTENDGGGKGFVAYGDDSEDELEDEAPALGAEPIPDSVKPLPKGSNVPAFAADVRARKIGLQARLMGYAASIVIFIALVVGGVMLKQKITAFWPPAAMIYEIAGIPVVFQGEGLVMESLSATIFKDDKENDILVLKGRVINIADHAVSVPEMIATLRSTNGEDGEGWLIDAPVDQVKSGASFAFVSNYPAVPRGVGSVNLSFIPAVDGIKAEQVASVDTTEAEAPHDNKETDKQTPRSPHDDKTENKSGHGAEQVKPEAEHHDALKAEGQTPAHH